MTFKKSERHLARFQAIVLGQLSKIIIPIAQVVIQGRNRNFRPSQDTNHITAQPKIGFTKIRLRPQHKNQFFRLTNLWLKVKILTINKHIKIEIFIVNFQK